jgi:hypothetical protein
MRTIPQQSIHLTRALTSTLRRIFNIGSQHYLHFLPFFLALPSFLPSFKARHSALATAHSRVRGIPWQDPLIGQLICDELHFNLTFSLNYCTSTAYFQPYFNLTFNLTYYNLTFSLTSTLLPTLRFDLALQPHLLSTLLRLLLNTGSQPVVENPDALPGDHRVADCGQRS